MWWGHFITAHRMSLRERGGVYYYYYYCILINLETLVGHSRKWIYVAVQSCLFWLRVPHAPPASDKWLNQTLLKRTLASLFLLPLLQLPVKSLFCLWMPLFCRVLFFLFCNLPFLFEMLNRKFSFFSFDLTWYGWFELCSDISSPPLLLCLYTIWITTAK